MPELRRHPGPSEHKSAVACLREVTDARALLRTAREGSVRGWDTHALRAGLLAALEGYAVAITHLGAPVPRKLRNEIELYRHLRNRL